MDGGRSPVAVAGVDTHKDMLAVAVIDQQGRELDRIELENSTAGHHRLVGWLRRFQLVRVGIEGSGSYGRAAALAAQGAGFEVVEVPPQLTAQARKRQRSNAKSDPIDALLIARITLREPDLPPIRPDGDIEDLRVLVRYRRELRAERNRQANGSTPTWCSSIPVTSAGSAGSPPNGTSTGPDVSSPATTRFEPVRHVSGSPGSGS